MIDVVLLPLLRCLIVQNESANIKKHSTIIKYDYLKEIAIRRVFYSSFR